MGVAWCNISVVLSCRLRKVPSQLRVVLPLVSRCMLHGLVHPGKSRTSSAKWKESVAPIIREITAGQVSMKVGLWLAGSRSSDCV